MKLCTALVVDDLCGEPAQSGRCEEHPQENNRPKRSAQSRGYNEAWKRLSVKARTLQPWCSTCGSTEDLTADHLRWPAQTLADVDVLCRSCNSSKGAAGDPRGLNRPGGKGQTETAPDPRRMSFRFTQFDNGSQLGGDLGG